MKSHPWANLQGICWLHKIPLDVLKSVSVFVCIKAMDEVILKFLSIFSQYVFVFCLLQKQYFSNFRSGKTALKSVRVHERTDMVFKTVKNGVLIKFYMTLVFDHSKGNAGFFSQQTAVLWKTSLMSTLSDTHQWGHIIPSSMAILHSLFLQKFS